MRITADIQEKHLKTSFDESGNDRGVNISNFIPIEAPALSYYGGKSKKYSLEWGISIINMYLNPALKVDVGLTNLFGKEALSLFLPVKPPPINYLNSGEKGIVAQFLKALNQVKKTHEFIKLVNSFMNNKSFHKINNKVSKYSGLTFKTTNIWDVIIQNFTSPIGTLDETSEIGYLFIDRTRIRPAGFKLGEHLYGLSLAPGEEVILEQKSSLKETTSFEESLEKEYEQKFSTETENSSRTTDSQDKEEGQESNTNIGGNLGVGGSVPIKGASVNADVGADASQSFAQSLSRSNQLSTEVANRTTTDVSTSLKSNHKTTFKITKESTFEKRSERRLKNPNYTTSLTLHYFKIMQHLKLQQERKGVQLCWAPFVFQPGSNLRIRMEQAKQKVFSDAIHSLDIPPEPIPPSKEFKKEWIRSNARSVLTPIFMGFSTLLDKYLDMEVRIPDDANFTGRLRVHLEGAPAMSSYAGIVLRGEEPGPDENGIVRATVKIDLPAGITMSTVFVYLEAEVQKVPATYHSKYDTYKELIDQWHRDVAEIKTGAKIEAQPKAEAAAKKVLESTDLRSDLLRTAIKQNIVATSRDEIKEIEQWHRLLDFENISFTLFPAWWSDQPILYPELGPTHLLNVEWARIFIPIRHIHNLPSGKTNEEKFLNLLYQPGQNGNISVVAFNSFSNKVTKDLRKEQDKFYDSDGCPITRKIGKEWSTHIPTDGTHVECVVGATTAADILTDTNAKLNTDILEAEKNALIKENIIRDNAATTSSPNLTTNVNVE